MHLELDEKAASLEISNKYTTGIFMMLSYLGKDVGKGLSSTRVKYCAFVPQTLSYIFYILRLLKFDDHPGLRVVRNDSWVANCCRSLLQLCA